MGKAIAFPAVPRLWPVSVAASRVRRPSAVVWNPSAPHHASSVHCTSAGDGSQRGSAHQEMQDAHGDMEADDNSELRFIAGQHQACDSTQPEQNHVSQVSCVHFGTHGHGACFLSRFGFEGVRPTVNAEFLCNPTPLDQQGKAMGVADFLAHADGGHERDFPCFRQPARSIPPVDQSVLHTSPFKHSMFRPRPHFRRPSCAGCSAVVYVESPLRSPGVAPGAPPKLG